MAVEALPGAGAALLQALKRAPSRRAGRPMDWPRPAILKGVPGLEAARQQEARGYVADKHFAPVPLALPLDWGLNPFKDKAWIMRFMCLQPADAYFYAYDETGEAHWLQKACALMLDWAQFHIAESKKAYLSWIDMACGYRAIKIALLIDHWLEGRLAIAPDRMALLLDAALAHVDELCNPETLSHGNHGIFQMHGLSILAGMLGELGPAPAARAYAATTMDMLVRKQFDAQGSHLEHSPQYHYWMCDELKSLLDSGWHEVDHFDAVHARAMKLRPWLTYPDGRLVPVGDTITQFRHPSAPDPADATFAGERFMARCLDAGYAIVRSLPADDPKGTMLFLQAAYHSKAHKHSDHLHLEFFDRGQPVLVDSGSTGYRGDARRAYCLSTRAHNTVEFDGLSHARDGSHAYGSALKRLTVFERGLRVQAEVAHGAHGVVHRRTVDIEPGRRLRVRDEVQAARPRDFIQWFHFAPALELVTLAEHDGHAVLLDGKPTWWIRALDPVEEVLLVRGQEAPVLQGWCAAGMDRLSPSWAVGYRQHGSAVGFRFELVRAGPRWPAPGLGREPVAVFEPPWAGGQG